MLVVSELKVAASEVIAGSEVLVSTVVEYPVIELLVGSLVAVVSEEPLVESVADLVELQNDPASVTVTVIEFAVTVIV